MPRIRSTVIALIMLAGAVTAIGCGSDEPAGPIPVGAVDVQSDTLRDAAGRYVYFYSAFRTRERIVVRNAETWAAMWDTLQFGTTGRPPRPSVDFSTHQVLIASMGMRTTGGFSIDIDRVADTPTQRWVLVRETTAKNCMTTQALTYPVVALVVPRSDQPVAFVEQQGTFDCE